ncbi:MAG: CapA family protein, partial [Chloroflexota bacterium]
PDILAALAVITGLDPMATTSERLVMAPDAAALAADLAAHHDRLGFLRASEVGPGVRALSFGETSYFGVARVRTAAEWPLTIETPAPSVPSVPTEVVYDPATAWTLFAGGDILLDRGIAYTVKTLGKGVDFPFDGGTATIVSHSCCSQFGWKTPNMRRTGGEGSFRDLIQGADLAIANFENPAPDAFRYHEHGTVFSADPKLIAGLANAGLDWVSLANNHIRDAGAQGVLDTIRHLDAAGIAHSGAGTGVTEAHTAALLDAAGTRVAFLGYDTIAPSYWTSTASRVGSAEMTASALTADIAAARAAGAQVVIVFPHWGIEYTAAPSTKQQRLARAAIDAGADMVIGNHPHWAGAVEIYEGRPIWYALGNFVFDQTWSEPTMEGITLELTFQGTRLVQAAMRPHVILDRSQPNFMDPAGTGAIVMNQVWAASKGRLPW